MINYYEILGLTSNAGIAEIKSAFRQLAKTYHPDVNPAGKERFSQILKAYETLSDPNLKYAYDNKLLYHRAQAQQPAKAQPSGKNWKFDEREMKRRQYYNDHIRKYEKSAAKTASAPEIKSNYNEFKYILLATPLAVVLFLLIMNLASPSSPEPEKNSAASIASVASTEGTPELKMGDSPYTDHFGVPVFLEKGETLVFKNLSGYDAIVCIFDGIKFIRSFFIADGYSATVSQLPTHGLTIRLSSGQKFSYSYKLPGERISGAFTSSLGFFESSEAIVPEQGRELTIGKPPSEGFKSINAKQFFRTK